MKYWLLTTEYPPLHGGGISTYCFFTARMLAEKNYTVTVFVQDENVSDLNIKEESLNIRVVRFNSSNNGLNNFLGYAARLSYDFATTVKRMIDKEGKPDFIEAQDYLGIAYYLTQFKHCGYEFLANVPIILTLHSPAFIYLDYNRVPTYKFPDFWTGEMEKQSIIAASALISPTAFLLTEIQKYIPFKNENIQIIGNPYKKEIKRNHHLIKNKIIYYGKLSPQKGSFELLAYFKTLWDNGFEHCLEIIGGTDIVYHPEMKTMGQMVKSNYGIYITKGLLKLQGKIKPSEISNYIADAHVIIFPSIVDNLPYVVMEVMSYGKMVLASIQGGQKEMIEDGENGFLFDHNAPATFENQLHKILALSDVEIDRISNNAIQRVKNNYSFDIIFSQKNTFLEEVKKNYSSKPHFPFLYQEDIIPLATSTATPDLLSIVIPYYNMGIYIDDCIKSINQSSYKKIEILIVNDGSTDLLSIKKLNIHSELNNVTIINTTNKGLADARNYGARLAKGEYLAFLDADDKIASSYYEKAITTLKKNNNVFFVGAWVKYFGNSSNIWPTFTPQPPYALVHNPINSSSLVYKRIAFLAGGLNDKLVDYGLEDYESVVNLLSKGLNGVVLPEILFNYRVRSGSMIRNITIEKLLYSNGYIATKHKNYFTKFAIEIIKIINANGPGHLFDNPTLGVIISVNIKKDSFLLSKIKIFIKKNEALKRIALKLKK